MSIYIQCGNSLSFNYVIICTLYVYNIMYTIFLLLPDVVDVDADVAVGVSVTGWFWCSSSYFFLLCFRLHANDSHFVLDSTFNIIRISYTENVTSNGFILSIAERASLSFGYSHNQSNRSAMR